jgi:hypothetical protein
MRGLFIHRLFPFAFSPIGFTKTGKQEWTLMSPVADIQVEHSKIANRVLDLKGKRIGLFWNGKPNGNVFLDEIANQLKARFDVLKIVKMWEVKPETRTALGNSVENLKFMAQNADLIIGASGD